MTGMDEGRIAVTSGDVLRFAPHAKFRFDEVRQAWIVLAPERLLMPDEQAVEILRLIDGERTVDNIIGDLVRRYEAPREVIAGDVVAMLQDLVGKKVLRR
jgi:pyrroloquinoline quinone biosynthesis protein D